jgi:hypothetical protein
MNERKFTCPAWLPPVAAALCLLAGAASANAQLQVDLELNKERYVIYEPILARAVIRNGAGREIELSDDGIYNWLDFKIEVSPGGAPVPPRNEYSLPPIQLGVGQLFDRWINITPIYPLTEFGQYRVRCSVYSREHGRHFVSRPLVFTVTEGRLLWQQTVGVPQGEPGAGTTRTVSLLSHRPSDKLMVYLRIEDKENGAVYCTHQLGRAVTTVIPDVQFDTQNHVHVLQNLAPKSYLYSHVNLSGQVLDQRIYDAAATRPTLKRDTSGNIQVVGGLYIDPKAPAPDEFPPPSIMDRPVPLPNSSPKKP